MKRRRLLALLTALFLLAGLLAVPTSAAYEDTQGHWAQEAIDRWSDVGILQGSGNDRFRPNDPMTRAEMAVVLDRLMDYQTKAENTFTDVEAGTWYTDAVLGANAAGVLKGTGENTMAPGANITREQAVVLLGRALGIAEKPEAAAVYTDAGTVSGYALGYVGGMTEAGILHGSNGKVNPKSDITRAEVATILHNAVSGFVAESGAYSADADKNVIVNRAGVLLKDMTVSDNLILAEGIGSGDVILENVKVAGKLIVRGGGEHSIIIRGASQVGTVVVSRRDGKVRVSVEDGAQAEVIYVDDGSSDVKLEGSVGTLIVENTEGSVEITGAVESLKVPESATGAQVNLSSTAKVENAEIAAPETKLTVSGTVGSLTVEETASGTQLATTGGAKIDTAETAANNVSVTGTGKVESLTVTDGEGVTVSKDTTVTKVENQGGASVDLGGKDLPTGETGSQIPSTGGGPVVPPPAAAPTFTDLALDETSFSAKATAFKDTFYNKGTDGEDLSEFLSDELWYVTIPGTESISESYAGAVTSVSLNGTALDKDAKKVSVGNNAFVAGKLYKVDSDGLKIALPIVALEPPVDGKLTFTVSASGYQSATAVIEVPALSALTGCTVSPASDSAPMEVTQESGTVTVLYTKNFTGWPHLLKLEYSGNNFSATSSTIYFTKKLVDGGVSYGFTGAEADGSLGYYPNKTAKTCVYTVATADRYGAYTLTIETLNDVPAAGTQLVTDEAQLKAALADAQVSTIRLANDIKLTTLQSAEITGKDYFAQLLIPEGKTVTLDLNDHTLSSGVTAAMTDASDSTKPASLGACRMIVSKGTLTIESGAEGKGEITTGYVGNPGSAQVRGLWNFGGTLTINGGKYVGWYAIATNIDDNSNHSNIAKAVTTIKNATVVGGFCGIANFKNAASILINTDVTADYYALSNNGIYGGTEFSVTGGTLESKEDTAVYFPAGDKLTLEDCTVISPYSGIEAFAGNVELKGTTTITAGTHPGLSYKDKASMVGGGDGSRMDGSAVLLGYRQGYKTTSATGLSLTVADSVMLSSGNSNCIRVVDLGTYGSDQGVNSISITYPETNTWTSPSGQTTFKNEVDANYSGTVTINGQ